MTRYHSLIPFKDNKRFEMKKEHHSYSLILGQRCTFDAIKAMYVGNKYAIDFNVLFIVFAFESYFLVRFIIIFCFSAFPSRFVFRLSFTNLPLFCDNGKWQKHMTPNIMGIVCHVNLCNGMNKKTLYVNDFCYIISNIKLKRSTK